MKNTSCDHDGFWRECLERVIRLGIMDGMHGHTRKTTARLVSYLTATVPVFYSRQGQQKALRRAYGAAYEGMAIARRAEAAAMQAETERIRAEGRVQ